MENQNLKSKDDVRYSLSESGKTYKNYSDFVSSAEYMRLEPQENATPIQGHDEHENFEGGFTLKDIEVQKEYDSVKKPNATSQSREYETVRLFTNVLAHFSSEIYCNYYLNFDNSKESIFTFIITNGLYFPQIMQFIGVMVAICSGHTSFKEVILANLTWGIGATLAWFSFELYKYILGINSICFTLGSTVFKYYLHFIAIAIVSFFVIKDWKIFFFCIIGGLITTLIKTILFAKFTNVKRCDKIAIYVSTFKT